MTATQAFGDFAAAAGNAVARLGSARIVELAARMEAGWPDESLRRAATGSDEALVVQALLAARHSSMVEQPLAICYLRGLADGYARQEARCQVEAVWSGPTTHNVPVRSTAAVLAEVINSAQSELVLMTYSAKPYQPVRDALASAAQRGVATTVVVETLQGAGSAISGSEPAAAFAGLHGVELWHWPTTQRTEQGAKQHAKLAAADRAILLVTSANLTASGAAKNMEAGLLIRGGTVPARAVEHIRQLQSAGTLERLL
ncbi:DISARM system phospholipase D-like protein DrmC [Kitasatospora purpeofusca]|uniref:DISARM system phospholipase D-like protein DrmC n=1 Tax=Kitasatospora purpeofusca TaxID=67352 RepID=UPI00386DE6B7|nr:DISARM system phospholipase D-like protein DrmC [Kitasatospora purpeofusca]